MKKLTKKDLIEMKEFNSRRAKFGEKKLTEQEYLNYIYGKGLPIKQTVSKKKYIGPSVPDWAMNPYDIPSAKESDHIAVKNSIMDRLHKESEEVQREIIKKKNSIAIPFSKGAYQYVTDESIINCLGRKL